MNHRNNIRIVTITTTVEGNSIDREFTVEWEAVYANNAYDFIRRVYPGFVVQSVWASRERVCASGVFQDDIFSHCGEETLPTYLVHNLF